MRIMVVGPTDADSFADNVAHTLTGMGHEVRAAGPARKTGGPRRARNAIHVLSDHLSTLDQRRQGHLMRQARDFEPELVITLDSRIRPSVVAELRRIAGRVVLWFPDAVSNLGKHEMFLAPYDRFYFKMRPLVDQLAGLQGLPVAYLPEAANADWHRPVGGYGRDPRIVVAGNIHPTRAILLERLVEAGIPLRIFGPPMSGWMDFPRLRRIHSGRSVVRVEKAEVFRSARGVLNNLHPAEMVGSNCRLFEAAACGAAVLTEWRSGMDELFVPNEEVLPFATFEELLNLCRRLIDSADFGRPIADAAARRARLEHTYAQRLERILSDAAV